MKEAGIQFTQISLDGASAETHDNFRGIGGVYEKTIRGIKNCVNEGFFVNIATTATKYNFKEAPKIMDLCEELGVNWLMAYNFVPTGRGKFISENDLTPAEREQVLKDLWEKLKNGGKVSVLSTAPQFARVALEAEVGLNEKIVPTHFFNPQLSDKLVDLAEFIGGCVREYGAGYTGKLYELHYTKSRSIRFRRWCATWFFFVQQHHWKHLRRHHSIIFE